MNRDIVCGCLTLVLAIAYYLMAAAIPKSMLADAVGPQGLPEAYGIVLGLLSLLLIASGVMAGRKEGAVSTAAGHADAGHQSAKQEWNAALRAAGMLLIGAAYVAILPWAGYIVSIALLIIATGWYQERKYMRWLVPVAIGGAFCFWLIFVQLLEIAEPTGLWPSLS
jgi:putative tricarboxylic transport membrane protein